MLCALLLMVQGLLKADRPEGLPNSVYVTGGNFHVQGIAIDRTRRCMYFSFTTSLVKTDLKGNVIGSVEHLTGHLGDLAIHPVTGDVYASLECKDDAIGASIAHKLGTSAVEADRSRFYVAIFRADRLTRKGMDASADSVMTTVYLDEPTCDYQDTVTERGRIVPHRHGCSGIDGITFAPAIGTSSEDMPYLYVGYGIYSDTTRTDNDHQVLLCYDVRSWDRYEKPMQWDALHTSGPAKPLHKYFVHTGNTRYGVQNLVYHIPTIPFSRLMLPFPPSGSRCPEARSVSRCSVWFRKATSIVPRASTAGISLGEVPACATLRATTSTSPRIGRTSGATRPAPPVSIVGPVMQLVRLSLPMKVGERSVHPQGSHQKIVVAGVFARHIVLEKCSSGGFQSLTVCEDVVDLCRCLLRMVVASEEAVCTVRFVIAV